MLIKDKATLKFPLQFVLLFPFILVIIGTVGIVGYIALINGDKAVNDVAHQLRSEVSARIQEHLLNFLSVPIQVNQFNATSMGQGWANPRNMQDMQNFFLDQVKVQGTITSIYYGNMDGGIVGSGREGGDDSFYVYSTKGLRAGTFNKYTITENGETGELLTSIPDFDSRTRLWYLGADQKGSTTWNDIYILFTGQDMAISASSPVYDGQHQLIGVVSVDIFLSQISKFLETLKTSESGQSFIMEHTGLLVASSTGEKPFVENNGKGERLDVRNSQSYVMRSTVEFLSERYGENYDITHDEQLELEIGGETYLLNVSPVDDPYGIDWISIVVIPEADFMTEIIASNRITTLVTLLALGAGILASVFISRNIASRISFLNKSTRAFARGEGTDLNSSTSRISEIYELTASFISMEQQLSRTLDDLKSEVGERRAAEDAIRQRVMELETINRISLDLRSFSRQDEMLSAVLNEALSILGTTHGSIDLHNKSKDTLEPVIMRGWTAQIDESPQSIHEGIAGKVFISGETFISHEFASDPMTREVSRSQIPFGWGGACLPIRTTTQILGVMMVSVPSERALDKNEIRLLSILSEMTGAALQRMQLHEQTVHRLEQLNALRAVDQAISSSRDIKLTLNVLLTHTISQLNVDAAAVLLLRPGLNQLELAAGQGFHTLPFESVNLRDTVAWRVIQDHCSIMMLDSSAEMLREFPQFEKLWNAEGFSCYWCVPLRVKGDVKGVLEVYCRSAFTPDEEWLEFLGALAGQAAISVDNTQLFENLQHSNLELSLAYDATIEGWSRAMDLRDHETEGHTQRVTNLTLKLAQFMQVSESQLTAIRRGALLHDIGKMGVPDSILLKEGKLTDEEWVLMRKHPKLAHEMLMPIAYLHDALVIPYCHHEKWDGTGYPQGLAGENIPLVARIFAIIDVWDALITDRPYRKKWTKLKARQYIKAQSGKHFDPRVVDAFLENIGKG